MKGGFSGNIEIEEKVMLVDQPCSFIASGQRFSLIRVFVIRM